MAAPDTSVSLLLQLKDPRNDFAWKEFVRLYGPLIYGFGLRRGVDLDDVDDFVQDVMSQVTRSLERFKYDPEIGKFRSWLFQVARNVWLKRGRTMGRRPGLVGGSTIMRVAESENAMDGSTKMEEEWEAEYRRQLFARACERVSAEADRESWNTFWRTAVKGEDCEAVASELGIAIGTLYVRRSRMLAKVKEVVREVEREWEQFEVAA